VNHVNSFNSPKQSPSPRKKTSLIKIASTPQEFTSPVKPEEQSKDESSSIVKSQILKEKVMNLLPRMKTEDEALSLENYINAMESDFVPLQTLGFMNLAIGGEWRLLFSTKLRGGPRPNFRITEMAQILEPSGLAGTIINKVKWELMQDSDSTIFDCFGTFSAICSYEINQGGRTRMKLNDHKIELIKGSSVPEDFHALVELLQGNMPLELFDPSGHAMDVTYIDSDFKIIRITGPAFEGIRNIFVRKGLE